MKLRALALLVPFLLSASPDGEVLAAPETAAYRVIVHPNNPAKAASRDTRCCRWQAGNYWRPRMRRS